MKKFFIISMAVVFLMGCNFDPSKYKKEDGKPNTVFNYTPPPSSEEESKESSSGLTIGPKLNCKPALNLSTGEIEILPSLGFGPRIEFGD